MLSMQCWTSLSAGGSSLNEYDALSYWLHVATASLAEMNSRAYKDYLRDACVKGCFNKTTRMFGYPVYGSTALYSISLTKCIA